MSQKKKRQTSSRKKEPARKKKTTSTSQKMTRFFGQLIPRNTLVRGCIYIILALFLTVAIFGGAGPIGDFIHQRIILDVVGYGFIFFPILCAFLAFQSFFKRESPSLIKIGIPVFILSSISLLAVLNTQFSLQHAGGRLGNLIGLLFVRGFDVWFSVALLSLFALMGLIFIFDGNFTFIRSLVTRKQTTSQKASTARSTPTEDESEATIQTQEKTEPEIIHTVASEQPAAEKPKKEKKKSKKKEESVEDTIDLNTTKPFPTQYVIPPLSLLAKSSGKPGTGDIKANANLIQRTLANFGIAVEMDEISVGPTVTRYAMKPAQGVRLSRIASLQNELALALAAKSIRIEAPIPGRSLVGVEVPNTDKARIGLGTLLAELEFTNSPKPLLVSLGKGVSGKTHFTDIGKMPHALIAGATGSGKSVTVHNIIISLLYRNGPDMMRFIMIDPKRVEMTLYKKIPHLLTPVITDPKKAVLTLKWAVKEMERRYDVLQKNAVRDIDSYHSTIVAPAYKDLSTEDIDERSGELPEKMPYIVVIIDELSDIMSAYPRELEASIVRLAQMSRAVGIHLLLSTQRPSVNVITGLIKANVPSRIALKVASQIDSRTILDTQGAEKLLGRGDTLYKGPEFNEPVRIQCPFVSEDEVKAVVDHINKHYKFDLDDHINLGDDDQLEGGGGVSLSDDSDDDPLYQDARRTVIDNKKASTSFLQRKLGIGYSRAARIMDILEERGVIGPQNGSKPREVLEQGINHNPMDAMDAAEDELARANFE